MVENECSDGEERARERDSSNTNDPLTETGGATVFWLLVTHPPLLCYFPLEICEVNAAERLPANTITLNGCKYWYVVPIKELGLSQNVTKILITLSAGKLSTQTDKSSGLVKFYFDFTQHFFFFFNLKDLSSTGTNVLRVCDSFTFVMIVRIAPKSPILKSLFVSL